MKLDNKSRLILTVVVSLIIFLGEATCVSLRKEEIELVAVTDRHKSGKSKVHAPPTAPVKFNATNNTLTQSLYNDLNNTFVTKDLNTFKTANRKFADNKLLDKQVEDIYQDLVYKQNKQVTPAATRAAIQIYTKEFEACDKDKDNVLNLQEFSGCMLNDTYLKTITPPQERFATYANYSYTNTTGFYPILYNLMDSYSVNYTNFHDYMLLRLMTFSWRKCSVNGPFIDEVSFECAIDIATGSKTFPRNTARKLYSLALELSNTKNVRNIDFIAYFIVAQSTRLYGKINGKEDQDATKAEFTLALDHNILPGRYNQEIVDSLFALVGEAEKKNQGIDPISFVFYDFILRLFEVPNAQQRWSLTKAEFTNLFNHYLYPRKTLTALENIPQNNLTAQSYQMYTYLNISVYNQESDHFLKFAQTGERVMNEAEVQGDFSFNLINTASWIFNMLDHNGDAKIDFLDYATFMQIGYLFGKFDYYQKGKIVSGDLFEKYTTYADFPYVGSTLRDRAKRFNLFPQDLYMDLMRTTLILKIDDIMKVTIRRVDPTTLYEVELKNVFNSVNLGNVPDAYLNKCLRGVDDNNVPKYDWECAFIYAVTQTSQYLESAAFFMTTKNSNLTLANTAFVNVDPQLK